MTQLSDLYQYWSLIVNFVNTSNYLLFNIAIIFAFIIKTKQGSNANNFFFNKGLI